MSSCACYVCNTGTIYIGTIWTTNELCGLRVAM